MQEIKMTLSVSRWIAVIALDVVLRAGYVFIFSLNPLNIVVALPLSFIHLVLLISFIHYLATFDISRRKTAVLLLTNLLFVFFFVLAWVYLIKSGRQTGCVRNECFWTDGVITSA